MPMSLHHFLGEGVYSMCDCVLETLQKTAEQAAKNERVAHLKLSGCDAGCYARHKKGSTSDPLGVPQHHHLNAIYF